MEVLWQSRLCQVSTRVAWKSTGRKERRKEHGNLLHKKRNFFFVVFSLWWAPLHVACDRTPTGACGQSLAAILSSWDPHPHPHPQPQHFDRRTNCRLLRFENAVTLTRFERDPPRMYNWVTDVKKILTVKFDVVWLEGRWEKFENDSQKCGPDCTGPNGCIIYSCQRELGPLLVDGPT